jgi:tetratricopeptide (TPR) repeat protein
MQKETWNQTFEKSAAPLVRQAWDHWRNGDLNSAQKNYEAAVAKLKEIREICLWFIDDSSDAEDLGDLARELGRYKEAIALYEMAWGTGYLKIGDVYFENLKNFDFAYKFYCEYLESHGSACGCYSASLKLAEMSLSGQGTPQNPFNALTWMNVAVLIKPDCATTPEAIEKLANELGIQDVQRATLFATEWLNSWNKQIERAWRQNPWSRI